MGPNATVHGRLGQRRGGRYASSHGQHGARAQRLPRHVKEIVQGSDDARDVSQETFCTSTDKCNLVATDIFSSAGASSRPSSAKVKLRSRTRTSKSRAISNLVSPP